MDVRKSFTDAGYIAVGLGVMGFQQAQVRRRAAPGARARRRHLRRPTGPASCRTASAPEGRNLDSKAPRGARRAEGTVEPDRVPRAGARLRGHDAASSRSSCRCRPPLGELPERVAQAIEPVAGTRPRALHQRRLSTVRRHSDRRSPHGNRRSASMAPARERCATGLRCVRTSAVSLAPVLAALAGGVGAARFLAGLVRVGPAARRRRDRQHRRRRRVPRPLRLARPRLGHVHARRRLEPRQGWGLEGETFATLDALAALRRPTRGSASATRTSRPTSTAPSGCGRARRSRR